MEPRLIDDAGAGCWIRIRTSFGPQIKQPVRQTWSRQTVPQSLIELTLIQHWIQDQLHFLCYPQALGRSDLIQSGLHTRMWVSL
jgi:hypothetical protein